MTMVGNIFNHPNFMLPASDISTAGVGVIGSTEGYLVGREGELLA